MIKVNESRLNARREKQHWIEFIFLLCCYQLQDFIMAPVDPKLAHEKIVANFVKMQLSYRFTVALLPSESENVVFRFLFSKPVDSAPEPAIVVYVDVEVLGASGTSWSYSIHVEGQKYRRIIEVNENTVNHTSFNESLIDKVFNQKAQVRMQHLWV
ncbi:Hypothetical protein, putative [Bodo saltans]|uniref:Uncharacterized protein n=1 Tax=Bodo saltans TaxID=75058 RepID=A0A0S4ILK7_BODSA|nr:Hypothetical protein, putative [Bodo saltans]|eukprot:CUF26545.1 Hypothetical protein, putative [Bodo saltans]